MLKPEGYHNIHIGKWHLGGTAPYHPFRRGFDEFFGFYPAQKEISQSVDARRYPDLVLNPELLKAYNEIGANLNLVHGFKGGKTTNVSAIKSTEEMGRADQVLADFTVAKINKVYIHFNLSFIVFVIWNYYFNNSSPIPAIVGRNLTCN